MGPARRPRSPIQSRACLNCQKRKSRCIPNSQDGGPCSYCSRMGKTCSFVRAPDRTPLTRKNLDASEMRCAQLEALLRSLHPELDIEDAISKLDANPQDTIECAAYPTSRSLPLVSDQDHDQTVHEFEWHEKSPPDTESPVSHLKVQDGMATFSTLDAGYLGSSSGSNLLQEIASMLPNTTTSNMQNISPGPCQVHPQHHNAAQSRLDPPQLASSAITSHLIDAYFLFYNTSYPIVHERTFREMVAARAHRKCKSTWNVIYFMVLAIGHWVSTSDEHQVVSKYYSAARSYLSIQMLESGTLEIVQAFLLMGNYLQKIDRPNTGYNLIGIAYKMALGLGLHRETPNVQDDIGHERRRQLFWVVYCFDSGFNITTGRPPNVSEGVIDTRIPKNIDDREMNLRLPCPPEVNCPTTFSAIIAQAQLAKIANAVYHEFLLAKMANKKLPYQVAEAFDNNLDSWRQSLPDYFNSTEVPSWFIGPRSVVLWKEQNLRIILWRASKPHHTFLPSKMTAEQKYLDAAMQSIHDIVTFCTAHQSTLHQGIAWYATYFLFQATLVLEASRLDPRSQHQNDDEVNVCQSMISKARDCLTMLAQSNKSASRCLDVLNLIHQRANTLNPAENSMLVQPSSFPNYQAQALGSDAQAGASSEPSYDFNDMAVNGFGLYDDASDPTLRMILNQTSWEYLDDIPMDTLFTDWIDSQFVAQDYNG